MSYPEKMLFFDVETTALEIEKDTVEHLFWFGVAQYRNYRTETGVQELVYKDLDEFWNWVYQFTAKNHTLYLVAHNTDFDFRVSAGFTHLEKRGFHLRSLCIEGTRFILRFSDVAPLTEEEKKIGKKESTQSARRIVVLDTMNWFTMSLKKMGDMVGFEKFDMPPRSAPFSAWERYCRRDVEVTRKTVELYIEFIKKHNLGKFSFTIASQSFNCFKQRFLKHDVEIHSKKRVRVIERSSYCGGRVEAFWVKSFTGGPFHLLDINSMYPYVMREGVYPVEFVSEKNAFSSNHWRGFLKNRLVIAEGTVTTNEPCAPMKSKHGLLFPVGTFDTVLCSPEILLLEERGQTFVPHRVLLYRGGSIFRSFVESLYELRLQYKNSGESHFEKFCKLCLNSCYGKFAQKNIDWEYVGQEDTAMSYEGEIWHKSLGSPIRTRCLQGKIFQSTPQFDAFDSFPAVASFVTSYARAYLYRLFLRAGRENVFYTDTDSLWVNQEGYERLADILDDDELGLLKREKSVTSLTINGLKDYVADGHVKLKGVGSKGKEISPNVYEVEQWEHLAGSLKKGRAEHVITRRVTKTLKRQYKKGDVAADGKVEPFNFDPS